MPHTNARSKDTQGENHSGGVSVIFSMINVKSARDKAAISAAFCSHLKWGSGRARQRDR